MDRSQFCLAALACLLLTGGCLGFLGEGAQTTPDVGPVSPAPSTMLSPAQTDDSTATATPSPTPAAATLSPNLSASGFGSAEGVARTHRATLRNTSFTVRFSRVRTVDGEIERRFSGVVRYDGAGTVYANITRVFFDTDPVTRRRIEEWSNGTTARRAVVTPNGTTIEEATRTTGAPTYADRIVVYLRSFRMSVTGWSRLGRTLTTRGSSVRLTPSPGELTVDDLAARLGFWEIRDGAFSMEVTGGAVRRYRARLVGHFSYEPVVWTEEFRFTRVGTTTVERPAWVTGTNGSRTPT
ncbi:MAG: hypothetical protein ABEH66_00140 [Halobacteriales archaeon]